MEVKREPLGGGADPSDFRIRQLQARDLLRGDLEGEDLERYVEERVMTTTFDRAVAWARGNSFFPLTFGLACCAIEQIHIVASRMDLARFGWEAFRASPRQADLIILSGRVSIKMAPVVRRIYDQMLDPKWAISMGACCSSMGVFNNYALVPGRQVHAGGRARPRLSAPRPRRSRTGSSSCGRRCSAIRRPGGASATTRSAPRSSFPERPTARTSTYFGLETRRVPDATELELTAQELRDRDSDVGARHRVPSRPRSAGRRTRRRSRPVLTHLDGKGYTFLASLHGVDYYPEEPRLGVLYELLDMHRVDRISVKARVPTDAPQIDSVVELYPGAEFPEREVYDMFGVVFEGHPDMRRILMPEDYEGYPQRRDFPVGGEPVLFTFNEETSYGKNV